MTTSLLDLETPSPGGAFGARINDYERRIADLERAMSVGPRYSSGAGAPGGPGLNGQLYYDNTSDRLYLSDGAGWIIMSESAITTFVPVVTSAVGTITTVGSVSFVYHRRDGWIDWSASIAITTNGTGAGNIIFTLPIAPHASVRAMGTGREDNVTGKLLHVVSNGANVSTFNYDNTYPASSGCLLNLGGIYRMTTKYS